MDIEQLNTLIENFGQNVITDMQDELSKNGSLATGNLYQSINYNYQSSIENILVNFISEDYATFVEQGRQAGTYPPISKIMQWCEVKGLPDKAAFPIAKNIFKFGIKPKPFLLNNFQNRRQEFVIELIKLYEKEIISTVKFGFKGSNS